jgi:hypothetical protein
LACVKAHIKVSTYSGVHTGGCCCADLVGLLAEAHEEVVRLDVSVDEAARVHVLYARNLHSNTHRCIEDPSSQNQAVQVDVCGALVCVPIHLPLLAVLPALPKLLCQPCCSNSSCLVRLVLHHPYRLQYNRTATDSNCFDFPS